MFLKWFGIFKMIVLCLALCFMTITPTLAHEENEILSSYTFDEKTEEERMKIIEDEFMQLNGLDSMGDIRIIPIEEEMEISDIAPYYTQTKLGEQTKTMSLGAAGNQYQNGVTFDTGGYIYWQDGGSTVSVFFSIGGSIFSVGESVGSKASGVAGYSMYCPANKSCKMGVSKTVKVVRYHLYGDGPNGQWYDQYINYQETLWVGFYNLL